MRERVTYRELVRDIALDQYGYVTTRQAVEVGVPAGELPKLAARGGLDNVAYGLYRVSDIPATALDQFAEALLRAGPGAYLHGDSVLALHGLADVNPRKIRVATRKRARPRLPPIVELTWIRGEVPTTRYEGLASQTVADAIRECRGRVEPSRLADAAKEARKAGLLTTSEWGRVKGSLRP